MEKIFDAFFKGFDELFGIPRASHIFSLPDLNGHKANFTGNGTYKYTNFTHGHSLEIHITETAHSSHHEKIREKMQKMHNITNQHKKKTFEKKMEDMKSHVAHVKKELKEHISNKNATNATAPSFLQEQEMDIIA